MCTSLPPKILPGRSSTCSARYTQVRVGGGGGGGGGTILRSRVREGGKEVGGGIWDLVEEGGKCVCKEIEIMSVG